MGHLIIKNELTEITKGINVIFEMALEGGLSRADFGLVAFPCEHNRFLQGAAKGEADRPREGCVLTNGSEISSGDFAVLPAAEEEDAAGVFRNGVFKNGCSGHADSI